MKRVLTLAYGVTCYLLFVLTLAYSYAFLGNLGIERSVDGPATAPVFYAVAVNLGLLTLFALQHSVMARPAFKAWWTRFVPVEAERSTYVLFTCVALGVLFAFWEPIGGTIWQIENGSARLAMYGLYTFGWVVVFVATCLINHFDLFGLRQVWLYFRGEEYTTLKFATPGPYRLVRHPLYIGWFIVMWATPTMTIAHLLFAITTTVYILIAIQFEERDLKEFHGEDYVRYQQEVPMLVPRLPVRTTAPATTPQSANESA